MSKSNTLENDFLAYFFQAGSITNLPASGAPFYVALFTADPGETGAYTNEANYTGYARQPVLRQSTSNGWAVSGTGPTIAQNIAQIGFPACTGGSETETYFAICSSATRAAGTLYYSGALSASLAVSSGITPQIAALGITISED
jgi:hypothetical protein